MRGVPQGLCSDNEGRFDHHKFWYHIACLTATIVFAKIGWTSQPSEASSMLFLVYLGCVGGSQLAQTFLQGKYGSSNGGSNGQSAGKV